MTWDGKTWPPDASEVSLQEVCTRLWRRIDELEREVTSLKAMLTPKAAPATIGLPLDENVPWRTGLQNGIVGQHKVLTDHQRFIPDYGSEGEY